MKLTAAPSGPLAGTIGVPGDKSISHRALIIASLAQGETRISGLLESDDVLATARALEAFGIAVRKYGDEWRVIGGDWRSPNAPIDCGNSGTSARLLMGAAASFDLTATFTGDESLRRRPMKRVTGPLAQMGARFEGGDTLPITLSGGRLTGIDHRSEVASAQVKSAILLAGLRASGEVRITEPHPSRDHTEIILRQFGCDVRVEGTAVELAAGRQLRARIVEVPGDTSSAAFLWLAAAIVPGSEITVRDVLLNPRRAGFILALQRMGGDVALDNVRGRSGETIGDVRVRHGPLFGAEFTTEEMPSMIDEIPALAVAAAFARGESLIEGLAELRHKESDRLAAIVTGLKGCGAEADAHGDALRIIGRRRVPGGAKVQSFGDHRIAMAFAVLGLAAERPVTVDGAEMIASSFPGFADALRSAGARLDELE